MNAMGHAQRFHAPNINWEMGSLSAPSNVMAIVLSLHIGWNPTSSSEEGGMPPPHWQSETKPRNHPGIPYDPRSNLRPRFFLRSSRIQLDSRLEQ